MGNRRWKFGIGIGIILVVALWEAVSGFQQSKTYYVTVSELLSAKTAREHIRVGGTVENGSITRRGGAVWFRLAQNARSIPVVYVGADTLPDTFKDGAQAIVQGDYAADGTFRAENIQAKCASKYQAAPSGGKASNAPGMSEIDKGAGSARQALGSGALPRLPQETVWRASS